MPKGLKYRGLRRELSQLRDLLISGRPLTSSIAGFLAGATAAFLPSVSWIDAFRAGVAFTLVTMVGFILNDVHDIAKDRMRGKRRPVTLGRITTGQALAFSVLLLALSLLLTPAREARVPLLLTAFAVLGYSFFAYRFPLLKGVYTGLLCCTPLTFGATVGRGSITLLAYSALVVFIFGREIILDILDVEADKEFGLQTIPARIGIVAARRLGVVLLAGGSVATVLAVGSPGGRLAAVAGILSLIVVLIWPGYDLERRAQLMRLPMLLGALALASTVWLP